jgi:uroporphyrinogen-III synthase
MSPMSATPGTSGTAGTTGMRTTSAAGGHRVLLTRAAEDCAAWAAELEARGAAVVVLPCIVTHTLDSPALRAAAHAAAAAHWWVFTSRRGVEAFAALEPGTTPANARIATVGDATGAAARTHFGRADLTGADGTAQGLAAALVATGDMAGTTVLAALAANAPDTLERALTAAGARCTRLDVYRTEPLAAPQGAKRALSALGADRIVHASPTAVTGLVQQVDLDRDAAIYTIGPSTTAAARAAGLKVTAQAREPNLAGILEAMQCPT